MPQAYSVDGIDEDLNRLSIAADAGHTTGTGEGKHKDPACCFKKPPLSVAKRESMQMISYSGDLDDGPEGETPGATKNDGKTEDEASIRSYQPSVDTDEGGAGDDGVPCPPFSRHISREDASSIIGGLNIGTPSLHSSGPASRRYSKVLDGNALENNSAKIQHELLKHQLEQTEREERDHFNDHYELHQPSVENHTDSTPGTDETQKVFSFLLPFSTAAEDTLTELNFVRKGQRLIQNHLTTTSTTDADEHRHGGSHETFPLLSKTFSKLSHMISFDKKRNHSVSPKSTISKRSHHPKAPNPPPNVSVYWDHIAHKAVPDEVLDRVNIKLQLERQESLDTLQEARYYKDTTSLDDGKLKALGKSLLPTAPLTLSKSISTKLSLIKNKREASPPVDTFERSSTPMSNSSTMLSEKNGESYKYNAGQGSNDSCESCSDCENDDNIDNDFNDDNDDNNYNDDNNGKSGNDENIVSRKIVKNIQGYNHGEPMENSNSSENHNTNNNLLTHNSTNRFFSTTLSPAASSSQLLSSSPDFDIYNELEGDILVLGGYRGSILKDPKTKKRTWIPVLKAGLNIRKVNIQLGPSDEDELRELDARKKVFDSNMSENAPDYPTTYPDGMLTHIGPVDISRKLIKRLNSNPNVNARDWGYDWRLSPELIANDLHKEIVGIVEKQSKRGNCKRGVILIAHSMGGIIAHGAMLKNPELVRAVIYAGTPMPCSNILGPLRFSDSILLSRDILSCEANFFMRSSYVFLPPSWGGEDSDGNGGGMCLFRDLRNGKRYQIDFWDVKNWVYYNLSPLVSSVRLKVDVRDGKVDLNSIADVELKHEIKEYLKIKINKVTESIVLDEISRLHSPVVPWIDSYLYLKRTLSRTKKFIKSLERKDDVNYPPMAQIFSNGVPSVKYSLVDGEECIKRGEYYRFFYGPGDGVVYQGWNFPRERGRKRLDDDRCGKDSVDPVENVPDWRGREYGYGEKYAYDLCGRFRGTSGHIGLLADHALVAKALRAVKQEEDRRLCGKN